MQPSDGADAHVCARASTTSASPLSAAAAATPVVTATTPRADAAHARSLRYGAPASVVDPLLSLLRQLHAMQERVVDALSAMGVCRAKLPRPFCIDDDSDNNDDDGHASCASRRTATTSRVAHTRSSNKDNDNNNTRTTTPVVRDAVAQYAALSSCPCDTVTARVAGRQAASERDAQVCATIESVLRWLDETRPPPTSTTDSDAAATALSRHLLSVFAASAHAGHYRGTRSRHHHDRDDDDSSSSSSNSDDAPMTMASIVRLGDDATATTATDTATTTTAVTRTRKRTRHVYTVVQPREAVPPPALTRTSPASTSPQPGDGADDGVVQWQCAGEFTATQAAQMTRQWLRYARGLRDALPPLRGTLRTTCASSLAALFASSSSSSSSSLSSLSSLSSSSSLSSRAVCLADAHAKWIEAAAVNAHVEEDGSGNSGSRAARRHLVTPACRAVLLNTRRLVEQHDALATCQLAMQQALLRAEDAMDVYLGEAEAVCAQERAYWRGVRVLECEYRALRALRATVRRVRADVMHITGHAPPSQARRRRRRRRQRQRRLRDEARAAAAAAAASSCDAASTETVASRADDDDDDGDRTG